MTNTTVVVGLGTASARRTCLCCILLLLVFGGLSPAAAQYPQDQAFGWSVTPYIWATDTKLDLAYRGEDIGGAEISFDDLLDVLDTAFMIHVEGGKGHWSMFGDLTYLETSDTEQRRLFTVDTDSEQVFLDAGVGYWPSGAGSNLSLIGGLRYTSFDDRYTFRVDDEELGRLRTSNDYYDALLGVRYRWDMSERWALLTHADFSFGDSGGTYLLRANFAVTVGARRQNRILFGYQYMVAEFEDGDVSLDYRYQGPMAGFNFRW